MVLTEIPDTIPNQNNNGRNTNPRKENGKDCEDQKEKSGDCMEKKHDSSSSFSVEETQIMREETGDTSSFFVDVKQKRETDVVDNARHCLTQNSSSTCFFDSNEESKYELLPQQRARLLLQETRTMLDAFLILERWRRAGKFV